MPQIQKNSDRYPPKISPKITKHIPQIPQMETWGIFL